MRFSSLARLLVEGLQLGGLLLGAEVGVVRHVGALLEQLELADRQQLVVVGGLELRPLQVGEDLLLLGVGAVLEEEVAQLVLLLVAQVVAPHQRVARDQRRLPDHLELPGLLRLGQFQALHALGIEGGDVDLLVGHRQCVDLMAGIEGALEGLDRVDVVLGEHVVAGHQVAGRGVRIAVAEGQALGVRQHVLEAVDLTVLVGDQQAPVARRATGGDGLGEDLAVGAIHRFHGGLVAVPGDVDLVETHALDDPGVVGGEEGLHLVAGLLAHVLEEGFPDALEVLRRLGGDDPEIDHRLVGVRHPGKGAGEQGGSREHTTEAFQHGENSWAGFGGFLCGSNDVRRARGSVPAGSPPLAGHGRKTAAGCPLRRRRVR